jgi:phytoene/squalene synthetase
MSKASATLAKAITKASSLQSYTTARLMVDQDLEEDCYRAYGYFRWVDDMVDEFCRDEAERVKFIRRQEGLVAALFRGEQPQIFEPEESILADLVSNEHGSTNLLRSYVENFLAIISFDARRKGRMIRKRELDWYAATLGQAVTDGIQYFVCNGHPYSESSTRYMAATAAHITHMLRDMREDLREGYINIPQEVLEAGRIDLEDWDAAENRAWVRERVNLARRYFQEGKAYLGSLAVLRCKVVGTWYCARFETILDRIERDGYVLREVYPKTPKILTWMRYAWMAIRLAVGHMVGNLVWAVNCESLEMNSE